MPLTLLPAPRIQKAIYTSVGARKEWFINSYFLSKYIRTFLLYHLSLNTLLHRRNISGFVTPSKQEMSTKGKNLHQSLKLYCKRRAVERFENRWGP